MTRWGAMKAVGLMITAVGAVVGCGVVQPAQPPCDPKVSRCGAPAWDRDPEQPKESEAARPRASCDDRSQLQSWWSVVTHFETTKRSDSDDDSLPHACELANQVVVSCPTFNTRAAEARLALCTLALREDIANTAAQLDAGENVRMIKTLTNPGPNEIWGNSFGKRSLAMSAARLQSLGSPSPEHRSLIDRARELKTDAAEVEKATRYLQSIRTSKCADAKAVEEQAKTTSSKHAAQLLTGDAVARRQKGAELTSANVRKKLDASRDLENVTDPESFRADIAEVKELSNELRCFEPNASAKLEPETKVWAEHLDQAIRTEVECRAKPSCMGERIAKKLCRGIELRRGLEGQIAEKRRYGAAHGVVSLTELHDLSKEVQSLDAEMAQLRAEHVALLKRPFNGACR